MLRTAWNPQQMCLSYQFKEEKKKKLKTFLNVTGHKSHAEFTTSHETSVKRTAEAQFLPQLYFHS